MIAARGRRGECGVFFWRKPKFDWRKFFNLDHEINFKKKLWSEIKIRAIIVDLNLKFRS
jgi:hypothetical protein